MGKIWIPRLGGIALLVPDNLAHDDYLFTAITLTHDLEMTLHFNQLSFRLYERSRTRWSVDGLASVS